VNTQNWGAGIGLNKFKTKTHVFLFSEFFPCRHQTIAAVHGLSGEPLCENHPKNAVGRRRTEDDYTPRGIYLDPYEGHLLRWTKHCRCVSGP
jgi:hypothetical protein